jgi:hypothetical protein
MCGTARREARGCPIGNPYQRVAVACARQEFGGVCVLMTNMDNISEDPDAGLRQASYMDRKTVIAEATRPEWEIHPHP